MAKSPRNADVTWRPYSSHKSVDEFRKLTNVELYNAIVKDENDNIVGVELL